MVLAALARPAFGAESAGGAGNTFALAWVRDEGAEGCPAGRDFADEVARRLGRQPFDERAPRSIEIEVDRGAGDFQSRVFVRERDGSITGRRVLTSPDCAALFSATALAVVLVIDPDALLRGDAAARQPPPRAELPATRVPIAVPERKSMTPRAPVRSVPDPSAAASPPSGARAGGPSASLDAALTLGLLPRPTPGVGLRVVAGAGPRWQVAAEALYATSAPATAQGARFDVGLTAFSLSALLDLAETSAVGVDTEAGVWAGALHVAVRPDGTSSNVIPTHPGDFPFLAASLGFHLRAHFTRAWFFDAGARGLATLLRRELDVTASDGPRSPVWTEPVVGAVLTAGFGLDLF